MPKDIMLLPANTKGRDVIIADLHGNVECLRSVIKQFKLTQADRLFIAGDLVDRGMQNEELMDAILSGVDNIYVVCGNHEAMFATTVVALMDIAETILEEKGLETQITEKLLLDQMNVMGNVTSMRKIKTHLHEDNGGMWVVKLFVRELASGLIAIDDMGRLSFAEESKVFKMSNYIKDLPYIISVAAGPGVSGFNVVHADMPISDLQLANYLDNQKGLKTSQKNHAIYTREDGYNRFISRTPLSSLTYCGHTIVGKKRGDCVRRDASTINLDGGAYYSQISLAVDHTSQQAIYVVNGERRVDRRALAPAMEAINEIQSYLFEKQRIDKIPSLLRDQVEQLREVSDAEFIKRFNVALVKITNEMRRAINQADMPEWKPHHFLVNVCLDKQIDEANARYLIVRFIDFNIVRAKAVITSAKDLEDFKAGMFSLIDYYDKQRRPARLLVAELGSRLNFAAASVSVTEVGLYAPKIDPAKQIADKLKNELNADRDKFIEEKRDEYADMFYTNIDRELDRLVDGVVNTVKKINHKIMQHNRQYPSCPVEQKSYFEFYQECEAEFCIKFNDGQISYIKNCFSVEECKQTLVVELESAVDVTDMAIKIRACHAKIQSIANEHNASYKPTMKYASLAELEHIAYEVNRVRLIL